jgi:hypothetical protein
MPRTKKKATKTRKTNSKKPRRRLAAVSMRDYKINPEHSVPRRAADYLNWLAERAPGRWVRYADLVKIVHVLKKKPVEDSRAVELFRNKMSRIKKILMEEYGRVPIRGGPLGVRASSDNDEVTGVELRNTVKRIGSSVRSMKKTRDLIDPRKLVRKENLDFYNRTGAAAKLLTAESMLKRLELPPKPEQD